MLDVDHVLAELSLEEKAALCTGATSWSTTPVERLGVPPLTMSDGPHGVRRVGDASSMAPGAIAATCFPPAVLLGSTWDPAAVRAVGAAIAREARRLGVDVVLGPGVNMKRTPLCGRNFEYFSEDPFLAGELGVAMVDGMQSQGVGGSLKHFAVNNQETRRLTVNAVVDERTMREIYLAAFETVVRRSRPWTVMCCYNRVNGAFGSENGFLMHDVLKGEWGFDGLIVSDWGAVHDRVAALEAGLDLEMPGPRDARVDDVVKAVRSGRLESAILDDSARRILEVIRRAEESEISPPAGGIDHHELARRTAAAGIVLLRNDGTLPLRDVGRIAVIGLAAVEPVIQGGGSAHVNPSEVDEPLAEIRRLAGGASVTYAAGHVDEDAGRPDLLAQAVDAANAAEVAVVFLSLPEWKEYEGADRQDLELPAAQRALITAVTAVQPRTVVVLNNGSAVAMESWLDRTAAVLEAWMPGEAGGGAIADILFGRVNPSGKLAETFPLRLADTPAYLNHPGEGDEVRYGEGMYIGYRWYDSRRMPTQFPFGFGLSYTTFEYGPPRVASRSRRDIDGITLEVEITNTGPVAGAEVIQVYVSDDSSSVPRPCKELKGFAKVHLEPGQSATATIPLDFRSFAFWHPTHKRWVTESGAFTILVGASSLDIRGSVTIELSSTTDPGPALTPLSTLGDWLEHPVGAALVRAEFDKELRSLYAALGGPIDSPATSPSSRAYMRSLPLADALAFGSRKGDGDPRARVAELIELARGSSAMILDASSDRSAEAERPAPRNHDGEWRQRA